MDRKVWFMGGHSCNKLYYAVSSPFWEAPLQQACFSFLLIPQYSTSGPAGWGQAEAAAGSHSSVQRAAQKRLLVTIFSWVLCHSHLIIIRINPESLPWHFPRTPSSRSTCSLGQWLATKSVSLKKCPMHPTCTMLSDFFLNLSPDPQPCEVIIIKPIL